MDAVLYTLCSPQVMQLLDQKGGPALGKAVSAVMDWQLAHPDGTLQEVMQHMRSEYAKQA